MHRNRHSPGVLAALVQSRRAAATIGAVIAAALSVVGATGCGGHGGGAAATPTVTVRSTDTPAPRSPTVAPTETLVVPSATRTVAATISTPTAATPTAATPTAIDTPAATATAADTPAATATPGACDVAHPCAATELCELPTGVCASDLDAGICVAVPSFCFEALAPVCACDGLTYGSDCLRRAARMQKVDDAACATEECESACDCYATRSFAATCPLECASCDNYWTCVEGRCLERCGPVPVPECASLCFANDTCAADELCRRPAGRCTVFGACAPRPATCTAVVDPVCGCDGNTYANECEAARAGVTVDRAGSCAAICGGVAGIACPAVQFCEVKAGNCAVAELDGACVDVPVACPLIFDPVCGCDGHTYGNDCERRSARVQLDYRGECENSPPQLFPGTNFG